MVAMKIIPPDSPKINEIEEYNRKLRPALYAKLDKKRKREKLLSENSSDKLIFVNIKNSYEAMLNNFRNNPLFRSSLYDCTRKYWKIDEEKFNIATHILGCYKGKVIEVINIKNRYIEPSGEFVGRKVFEGIEQPNSPYMGMDLHEIFDSLANFRESIGISDIEHHRTPDIHILIRKRFHSPRSCVNKIANFVVRTLTCSNLSHFFYKTMLTLHTKQFLIIDGNNI